jgi:hypothetical protein
LYPEDESIIYTFVYYFGDFVKENCKAWEFFTPFNLFGEPLPLIGLELVFWATIAFAEAFVMSSVFEWK